MSTDLKNAPKEHNHSGMTGSVEEQSQDVQATPGDEGKSLGVTIPQPLL